MKAQEGILYNKVSVTLLPNKKANREAILQGLLWLKTKATNKDVAMVFMAGHGLSRDGVHYDFLPVGADKTNPDITYLHDFELKAYMSKIQAKLIAFIDTCHSGNLFKQTGARDVPTPYMKTFSVELAKTSFFIVIFTSSTGEELSLEKEKWENGAFTKAVIEGFDGKAANEKGMISVARLNAYVADRVQELPGGSSIR